MSLLRLGDLEHDPPVFTGSRCTRNRPQRLHHPPTAADDQASICLGDVNPDDQLAVGYLVFLYAYSVRLGNEPLHEEEDEIGDHDAGVVARQ